MRDDFNLYSEAVEKYGVKGKIFKAFVEQLRKDCRLAGLNFKFSGKKDEVMWELKDQLDEAIHSTASEKKISNLLYRIDVPERKLEELLSKTHVDMDHISSLCEVIAGRVLQKVILRMQYSNLL